ncbi:MAG: hypothetical protein ACT4R6_04480 [Gemmatimonadaceae bacterium]
MRLCVRSITSFGLTGVALAAAACASGLDVPSAARTWGFIQIGAAQGATAGTFVTRPNAQFFKGALSSIPDARQRIDSCVELALTPSGQLNVTYLDAGSAITAQLGSRMETLSRVSSAGRTTYESGAAVSYRPGDSVVVRIPGAAGGFPAAEIRAKTAEAFTLDSLLVRPAPAATQLRWSAPSDQNSAMLAEFRYSPTGGSNFTRVIRCAFVDDGVDSVAFRILQPWAGQSPNARDAIFTRLRTQIEPVVDGFLEVISTFAVPTPRTP